MTAMTTPAPSPEIEPATRTGAQLVVDTLGALGVTRAVGGWLNGVLESVE